MYIILCLLLLLSFPSSINASPKITVNSQIDLKGLEAIRILMTPAQAQKAGEIELVNRGFLTPNESCYYLEPIDNEQLKIGLMVSQGKIVRIDVWYSSKIKTLSGAGIGSSTQEIKAIYGNKITQKPHPYIGNQGSYLIFTPEDDFDRAAHGKNDRSYAMIFETTNDIVDSYRVGRTEFVKLIEGCI